MGRARAAHLGPELRRPLVLDAALPLFARDGFEAVSMQAIADAAGVSKPVLYSCYDSKEELFEELLRREERKFWHMVEESVPALGALGAERTCCATAWRRCCARSSRRRTRSASSTCSATARTASSAAASTGSSGWARSSPRGRSCPSARPTLLGRMLVALAELGFRVQLDEPGAVGAGCAGGLPGGRRDPRDPDGSD